MKDSANFEAVIYGYNCSGKISIHSGRVFLCQNTVQGFDIPDKKGYEYSWLLDENVTDLVVKS